MLKLYSEYQNSKDNENSLNKTFDNRVPVPSDGGECIVWHEADYTPEMVQAFLAKIIAKAESEKSKIRGPFLAQLELYRLLQNESLDAQVVLGQYNKYCLLTQKFNVAVKGMVEQKI